MPARKRKVEPEPNLVDDYSELCDALKAKYKMNEGDWKALLDLGMALYKKIPTESAVAAANDAAAAVAALIRAEARVLGPASPEAIAILRERARERIALGRPSARVAAIAAALARPSHAVRPARESD